MNKFAQYINAQGGKVYHNGRPYTLWHVQEATDKTLALNALNGMDHAIHKAAASQLNGDGCLQDCLDWGYAWADEKLWDYHTRRRHMLLCRRYDF